MEIKVIESTIVRPAEETPRKRLWVSTLDLLVPTIHVSTVYFYESDGSPNFFEPEALKDGLSKALVPFYPVAGRLGKDKHGRLEIDCNAEGALFVRAETDFTLRDLGELSCSSHLKQFIPFVDRSGGISSYPLLALQVTRLKCGAVCVGVGFHHTVVDGTAAIHFINTWSTMVRDRGASTNVSSPSIDRTLLRARLPPNPKFHHKEYYPPPPRTNPPRPNPDTNNDNKDDKPMPTVLKLTLDQLNILKTKSLLKDETCIDEIVKLSTYEILAAHIWRCLSKARNLPDDQDTTLYIPTDGRSRLHPPLPPSYLGNVLFTNTLTFSAGDVQSKPLVYVASKIHDAIMQMSDEYLRSAIDFLELQSDLSAFMRGANTFASPNVNVISWMRMPIYDADFGWGRPIYMGPTTVAFEGNIYVMPSRNKDEGLSVVLYLKPHQMELFKKYLYDL